MFKNVKYFDVVPSTNQYLKENYKSLANYLVVSADKQTSGRGRLGRVWNDGDDLLFSILIKDKIANPSCLSLVVGSALVKALEKYIKPLIKWPNDILVEKEGKLYKIAGILLEAVTYSELECIIIGIGLNVNTDAFSDDLKDKAMSLKMLTNHKYNKQELLKEFLTVFSQDYHEYLRGNSDYLEIQRSKSCLIGKSFKQDDKDVKVIDILENGNILLEVNGIQFEKSSGEITLQNVYKGV